MKEIHLSILTSSLWEGKEPCPATKGRELNLIKS